MTNISTLRVLLIDNDPTESERISTLLENANHAVLPLTCLEEAAEALDIQRFDAVLLRPGASNGELQSFTAKLRQLEERQRSAVKVPVLCFSEKVSSDLGWIQSDETDIDGYLTRTFEPAAFASAVESLAGSLARAGVGSQATNSKSLPVFDTDAFQEQMAYDNELAVEIIDLFLGEYNDQVVAMRLAFDKADLPELSRVAHSIKGSLGSLHAMQSRLHAEELELAAKRGEEGICGPLLGSFVQSLEILHPELLRLRNSLAFAS